MPLPKLSAVAELISPITWFTPMRAFACGVVASGVSMDGRRGSVVGGVALAGQTVNDWFDRHVDAINQPQRPIPSGRMPGWWGLYLAVLWTLISLLVATSLVPWGFGAAAIGLLLAWAYSAPPVRLKSKGWWGNAACGVSYEGIGRALALRHMGAAP